MYSTLLSSVIRTELGGITLLANLDAEVIKRRGNAGTLRNVGVNFSDFDAGMAQQLLNRANIGGTG